MLYIWFAIIFGLAFLVTLLIAVFARKAGAAALAVVLALVLIVGTAVASFTKVDARAVGIQTTLGVYTRILPSGVTWTAPWADVEQFSTQIQPLDLSDMDDSKGQRVTVAYAAVKAEEKDGKTTMTIDKGRSGGNGWANLVVRWYINEAKAEALWKKYKSFDKVQEQLVTSEAQDAVREVLGGYDANAARAGANVRPISDAIKTALAARLADDGILIDSVSIKGVDLDQNTAASLSRTNVAGNNIETAKMEQERARIDNATAKLRQDSGALSDANLARTCLDIVNAWDVKKNGELPPTFNCGLGSTAGTSLLVGTK